MDKNAGGESNSPKPEGTGAPKLAGSDDHASQPLARIESPSLAPAQPAHSAAAEPPPTNVEVPGSPAIGSEAVIAAAASPRQWMKMRRLTPLAATIAAAAVLGAMAGSMASAGLGYMWLGEAAATSADAGSGRNALARLEAEVAALKSAVEISSRSTASQAVKLGNRIDGFERAQVEQAARLAKLEDAADRIEHRAPASSSLAHDITGSIAAPSTRPAAAQPASPPVIQGWSLRGVSNGAALIQRRLGGVIAVMPGDSLPGLGQIESIHRRDGRWVVMTSRGMIVTR